jgi:hypothetical protein
MSLRNHIRFSRQASFRCGFQMTNVSVGSKSEILMISKAFPLFPRKRTSFERLRVHALGVSVSGVGTLTRYDGANATSRTAQPSPHGGAPRSAFTITLPRVSAPLRAGKFMGGNDSNKKPPKVSLRRLFGPLGDPLVCTPFLDDGTDRV